MTHHCQILEYLEANSPSRNSPFTEPDWAVWTHPTVKSFLGPADPSFATDRGQSPNAMTGGLPVALFDGSVRTIGTGVSEQAFWSAITPAGGEVAGLD